jgi:hypothetical protein
MKMQTLVKQHSDQQRPFFGVQKNLVETINSLDMKWYVEFWEEHFYFLGIEVYARKKEKVVKLSQGSNNQDV